MSQNNYIKSFSASKLKYFGQHKGAKQKNKEQRDYHQGVLQLFSFCTIGDPSRQDNPEGKKKCHKRPGGNADQDFHGVR